jgi:hypothetical protein
LLLNSSKISPVHQTPSVASQTWTVAPASPSAPLRWGSLLSLEKPTNGRPTAGGRRTADGAKGGRRVNWRNGEGAGRWRKGWRWVRLHFTPAGHCRRQRKAPAHQRRTPRQILLNIESGCRPVQEQGDRVKDLGNLANSHGLTVFTLALA